MCGIGAIIGATAALNGGALRAMMRAVAHRGPDDEGYALFGARGARVITLGGAATPQCVYDHAGPSSPVAELDQLLPLDVRCALGHRRLSIVDVSAAGHQPMASVDGRRWISFNGEIYNYRELRDTLIGRGHRFCSATDTEVLLAAYAEWGESFLHRLNGMFAFILVDLERDMLLAARDRLGVKPLYYRRLGEGTVAFGSEIKQLLVLESASPRANVQRVYDFLAWSMADHTNDTMFADVQQLSPGCLVTLPLESNVLRDALRRFEERRWYVLAPAADCRDMDDPVRHWGELLRDSVRIRLRADVPLGSCLSGGLDSSTIVCLVHDELSHVSEAPRQPVFTAVSDEPGLDERSWVRAVVEATDAESHEVHPTGERLLEELDLLTWHQDEPFGSTSIYAQWSVFALAAARGVTVMLDGQGADEQLGGYHGFLAARHAQLLRGQRLWRLRAEMAASRRLHGHTRMRQLMEMANLLLPERVRQGARRFSGRGWERPQWLDIDRLGVEPRDPQHSLGALSPDVRRMSYAQLTRSNLQMLLHWEDRSSMAHSIEAREPFLDYRLVEYTLGLPDELKVADGITKRVLRDAMRGVLPEVVRTRTSKLGFATPEALWLTGSLRPAFRARIGRAVERADGVLRPTVMTECDAILEGRQRFTFVPWRIISLGAWLEQFDVTLRP